ncbi:Threonine synthase [bacterium HR39]|nr:Threonine synthase [bacterium HR39]
MFERALSESGRRITVVGATSGDTGSAAIHALAGRRNIAVVILHPHGRVSEVQRRQMTTVTAPNVLNVAVRGTFDDCQRLVKQLFADARLREELGLAAVNSINWARIAAQSVYYAFAAVRLGGLARPVLFSVPTGNFGDVYAGHVARRMGLPLRGLVVATNENDILARFLETGRYEPAGVRPTITPAMDIQVASNFERLLFELFDGDGAAVAAAFRELAERGGFSVPAFVLARARALFRAGRADQEETRRTIAAVHREAGVVIDPHTAVAVAVGRRLRGAGEGPLVHLATAHPAKFPDTVREVLGIRPALPPAWRDLFEREERCMVLDPDPAAIAAAVREHAERAP